MMCKFCGSTNGRKKCAITARPVIIPGCLLYDAKAHKASIEAAACAKLRTRAVVAAERKKQRDALRRRAEDAMERGDEKAAVVHLKQAVALKRAPLPDKESADGDRIADALFFMKHVPGMGPPQAARIVLAIDHSELPKQRQQPGDADSQQRINALAQSIRRAMLQT